MIILSKQIEALQRQVTSLNDELELVKLKQEVGRNALDGLNEVQICDIEDIIQDEEAEDSDEALFR